MRYRAALTIALGAIALLSRCGGDGTFGVVNPPPPPSTAATFTEIQDQIFTVHCIQCHSEPFPPQNLNLSEGNAYALLVNVPSVEISSYLRVAPGNASASYLVMKIEGSSLIAGERMPFGGPYLSPEEIAKVRSWIDAGAQNN